MKMRGTSQEDQFSELESFYGRVESVVEERQPRRKLELSLTRSNVATYYSKRNKPNWNIWLNLAEIPAYQAVLLSMDFEPDRANQIVNLWRLGVSMRDIPIHQDRERLLLSHIGRHGKEFYGNDLSSNLKLIEFVVWAKKLDWDMPEELSKVVCRDLPQALPIKEEESSQKLGERAEISTMQAVGIMAHILAGNENRFRKGENNTPNAKAIGDAVATKAKNHFGNDVKGFDSFNKKISEALKLLDKN